MSKLGRAPALRNSRKSVKFCESGPNEKCTRVLEIFKCVPFRLKALTEGVPIIHVINLNTMSLMCITNKPNQFRLRMFKRALSSRSIDPYNKTINSYLVRSDADFL